MIGYTSNTTVEVEDAFNSVVNNPELTTQYPILIVKNVTGMFWSPEFGINNLGSLLPGYGYLIYMNEGVSSFTFSQN